MALQIVESWGCAPDAKTILNIAESALQKLNPIFPEKTGEVRLHVQEFADEETLEALYLDDAYALLGVYSGIALSLELHAVSKHRDAEIWLFRMPILRAWAEQGDITLEALITQTLVTELAAHYRWTSTQIAELYQAASLAAPDFE